MDEVGGTSQRGEGEGACCLCFVWGLRWVSTQVTGKRREDQFGQGGGRRKQSRTCKANLVNSLLDHKWPRPSLNQRVP